jgi:hypothetical protein
MCGCFCSYYEDLSEAAGLVDKLRSLGAPAACVQAAQAALRDLQALVYSPSVDVSAQAALLERAKTLGRTLNSVREQLAAAQRSSGGWQDIAALEQQVSA